MLLLLSTFSRFRFPFHQRPASFAAANTCFAFYYFILFFISLYSLYPITAANTATTKKPAFCRIIIYNYRQARQKQSKIRKQCVYMKKKKTKKKVLFIKLLLVISMFSAAAAADASIDWDAFTMLVFNFAAAVSGNISGHLSGGVRCVCAIMSL